MFILRKLISSLVELPGSLILLLILIQIVWRKKIDKAPARGLRWFTFLLIFISLPLTASLIMIPLEKIPTPGMSNPEKELSPVIMIMGGGARNDIPSLEGIRGNYELGRDSLSRTYTGFLAHKQSGFPLYVSGGNYDTLEGVPAGEMMAQVLASWGVNEKKIITETQARTSKENADYVLKMLPEQTRRIYLVTSALHMKRSLLIFRKEALKQGRQIELIPLPCDKVTQGTLSVYSFFPEKSTLCNVMSALHEYLGIILYQLTGK